MKRKSRKIKGSIERMYEITPKNIEHADYRDIIAVLDKLDFPFSFIMADNIRSTLLLTKSQIDLTKLINKDLYDVRVVECFRYYR